VEVKQDLPTSIARAEMKVIFIFAAGVIVGLLSAGNVFGQSNKPASQMPSAIPVAPLRADTSSSRDNYAGDSACASCHRERVDSFHQTAHYLTSRLPDRNSILGSFMPGANAFTTSNPDLSFRMDAKGSEFFQTAVQGIAPYTTERTERFGFVVGSGGKGQTYLFWKGDQLFQLPVSYWTELGWINSPGYRDGVANFDRPIVPRCLECHATYFEATPPPFNRYYRDGFVVGLTCEKCHGPGREHVKIEGSKSGASGSGILNPAKYSRDRRMEVCAWCHAGAGAEIAPAFSYLPGEALSKYLALPPPDPNSPIDVHGSQVELLEKSRCFQSSEMTCSTCHDVHTRQNDPVTFSRRCLSCHKPGTAMFPKLNHKIDADCIDCHMPKQETNLIVFDWKGRKLRPQVRAHWIKAYPATNHSD
jgi:hypothetical protein